jgi:hypothetical protein
MSQWYPPPGSMYPGPGGQRGTTAPPPADADDYGHMQGDWYPEPEPPRWAAPAADSNDHGYMQDGSYPGHAPAMAYGQPGPAATAPDPEQYRHLHARTTRMVVYCGVLACATLVFLVAGAGHYSASSGALGGSVLLVNLVRMFQLLSRRKRIAAMTGFPDTGGRQHARRAGSPVPAGYDMAAAGAAAAAEFSQQFCSVTRVTAGGNLNAEVPAADFLVLITGGWLSVIQAPAIPVFTVPASEVQITTPPWQRKIGAGTILRAIGQLWSVQFDSVYRAEAAQAGRGGAVRMMLTAGAPRRSIRRGREINKRFTTALLTAGAVDAPATHAPGAAAYR